MERDFSDPASWAACLTLNTADPAVLSVLVSLGLLAFGGAWMRRFPNTPGQAWLVLAMAGMAWWLVATGLEISSSTQSCKMTWSRLNWPGVVLMPTAWAFFLYEYALARKVPARVQKIGLIFAPAIILTAVFTNGIHQQFYDPESQLVLKDGRVFIDYVYGNLFYASVAYIYVIIVSAACITLNATLAADTAVRGFFNKLLGITFLPMSANLLYLTTGATLFGVDPTPFAFSISVVFIVWLMADNRWVDVSAIGRDLLYYHSGDPIFIVELDGRLCEANPAAEALYGASNVKPGRLIQHIPKIGQLFLDVQIDGSLADFPIIRKGARSFTPRFYPIDLLHVKSKLGWVIALIDVSAQEDAAERAQAADLAKTQFLSTVSHELRTPLTVIVGALKMLKAKERDMPVEKSERLLKMVEDNAHTLARLVDDLLDVQRIDNAELSTTMDKVDLNQIARNAMSRIESYQTRKPIAFELTEAQTPLMVNGDAQRLGQVLSNILSNAIKFSGEPGEVKLKLERVDGTARISVSDNGIGIPENARAKVFGRFTQVDSSDTRNRGGSGLGMHISQQIMAQHKGGIDYESAPGKGTTFIVTVPLLRDTAPEAGDDPIITQPELRAAG